MAGDAESGLTETEAAARLAWWGPNVLPGVSSHGPLVRLLLQFHNPLIYVLLGAVVAAAVMGDHVDAGVILTVVVVNALVVSYRSHVPKER